VKSYGHLLRDALKAGKLSTINLEEPVTAIFWVEDGVSMFLQRVGAHLQDYMVP
jgi:hypothetical protein